jgi:hypothetical protein
VPLVQKQYPADGASGLVATPAPRASPEGCHRAA